MNIGHGYKQLIIWQKADKLAFQVYLVTKTFPREELYGITSQLRRSALSVPTNIAEGYGRQNKGELRQFINIALGSLAEVRYLSDFCLKLNYLTIEQHTALQNQEQEVGRLLWGFYKGIK